MKRSRSVRLTLMSAATVSVVAACDSSSGPPPAYTDIAACVSAGNADATCKASYEEALKEHQEKAPRFTSKDECLKAVDVTDCVETAVRQPDGSTMNMFVPLMAGYMLANAVQRSGGGYYRGPVYYSRYYGSSYRDLDDMRTARPSGSTVSRPTLAPSMNRPANVRTTSVSRSGFGSSGSSFGRSSS